MKIGDICEYYFDSAKGDNKSKAIVQIEKIYDDPRGIAEVKFLEVIKDDTGNGMFNFLFESGQTMAASLKYLHETKDNNKEYEEDLEK